MKTLIAILVALALAVPAAAQDSTKVTLRGHVMAYGTDFQDNGSGNGVLAYNMAVAYDVLNLSDWIPLKFVGSFVWQAQHDVLADSGPFKEINYEPGVNAVYMYDGDYLKTISAGFVHESTGEDSTDSGGWNRVTASAVLEQTFEQYGITVRVCPTIAWVVGVESTVDGIADTGHLGLGVDNLVVGGYIEIDNAGNTLRIGGGNHQIWAEGAADLIPGLNDMRVFGRLFSGNAETLNQWNERDIGAGIGVAVAR